MKKNRNRYDSINPPGKMTLFISLVAFILSAAFETLRGAVSAGGTSPLSSALSITFFTMLCATASYLASAKIGSLKSRMAKRYEDLRRIEAKLMAADERFRMLIENAVESLAIFDLRSGAMIDCNSNACQGLGYSREEFMNLGLTNFQSFSEKISADFSSGAHASQDSKPSERFEARFRKKDGSWGDVSASSTILGLKGNACLMLSWREITSAKRLERDLQENNLLFETLIETIPLPLFYKNKECRYIGCNSAFERFSGASKNQIMGKTVFELGAPKEIAEKYHEKDTELLKSPGIQKYQWKVMSKSLGLRDVFFHKATFSDSAGSTAGIVGAIYDITEIRDLKEKAQDLEGTLAEQNLVLLKWISPGFMHSDKLSAQFREIIQTLSRLLNVERVGIWFYSDDFSKLCRIELYERKNGWSSSHEEVAVRDFPVYFSHLKNDVIIAADDVGSDYRTVELLNSYLLVHDIRSMMDLPINLDGRNIGVICCEHKGECRVWTAEQQNFGLSAAQIVSMMLEISKRREIQKQADAQLDIALEPLLDDIDLAIIVCDSRGVVIFSNKCSEKIFADGRELPLLGSKFPFGTAQVPDIKIDLDKKGIEQIRTKEIFWKNQICRLMCAIPKS